MSVFDVIKLVATGGSLLFRHQISAVDNGPGDIEEQKGEGPWEE
jgi:hypothetical protein